MHDESIDVKTRRFVSLTCKVVRMSERRVPSPGRRNERSHRAILTAATDLVAEVGYSKLTVEAIAARAGVGKQTIYRWWPSKGAVVFDAFLALQEGDEGTALPDTGDLRADLTEVLRGSVAGMVDPRFEAAYRALTTEIQHDPELAAMLLDRLLGPLLEATRDRLRAAQFGGEIDEDVPLDVAVELLYGPIYHRWLLRTGPLNDEHADAVVGLVLRALGWPRESMPVRAAGGNGDRIDR